MATMQDSIKYRMSHAVAIYDLMPAVVYGVADVWGGKGGGQGKEVGGKGEEYGKEGRRRDEGQRRAKERGGGEFGEAARVGKLKSGNLEMQPFPETLSFLVIVCRFCHLFVACCHVWVFLVSFFFFRFFVVLQPRIIWVVIVLSLSFPRHRRRTLPATRSPGRKAPSPTVAAR